jgi:hypothetical protein
MSRRWQVLLIGALLPLCWLWMMAVHELGHATALWATGGTVLRVVLNPLTISRTDPGVDPYPALVIWAGPVVGALLPLAAAVVARAFHFAGAHLLRFFAGFCLIANGCYLGIGAVDPVGDARELLRLDTPAWQLGLFGVVTVPLGLYLWHGQGRYFARENARPVTAVILLVLLLTTATVEMIFSPE